MPDPKTPLKTTSRSSRPPLHQQSDTKPSYHHGDLRNALIAAGLESLEVDGPERLSLRAVAAKVGVSHAAPAHHFGAVKGLRTALATVGFSLFAEAMQQARVAAGPEPGEQMRAVGASYLAFAQSRPALFSLMFTEALLDWSDTSLQEAGMRARAELSVICQPAADRLGLTDVAMREALERLVWSCAHGVAHLTIGGQFKSGSGANADVLDLSTLIFGGQLRLLVPER